MLDIINMFIKELVMNILITLSGSNDIIIPEPCDEGLPCVILANQDIDIPAVIQLGVFNAAKVFDDHVGYLHTPSC
jgi:hypothetical protein